MQGMLLGPHNLVINMTVQDEVAAMNLRGTVYPVIFSMPGWWP